MVVACGNMGDKQIDEVNFDKLYESKSIPCYNSEGIAQRCVPMFENAAYQKMVSGSKLYTSYAYVNIAYCIICL